MLFLISSNIFVVQTAEVKIITRLGKFKSLAQDGLNFKTPFLDSIVKTIDLRVKSIEMVAKTKTKDGVFVSIPISVQTKVIPERAHDYYFKLSDPNAQIKAFVDKEVLGFVPLHELDNLYSSLGDLAQNVMEQLKHTLSDYGVEVVNVLTTDVLPDEKVVESMNAVNAAKRNRDAAKENAGANKQTVVTAAEAEAESMKLRGKGIADERSEITKGLEASIEELKKAIPDASGEYLMNVILLTQYFDTIKKIGEGQNTTTIFLPASPTSPVDFMNQLSALNIAKKDS